MGLRRNGAFVAIFFVILSGEVSSNLAMSFSVKVTFEIPFFGNFEELPGIYKPRCGKALV